MKLKSIFVQIMSCLIFLSMTSCDEDEYVDGCKFYPIDLSITGLELFVGNDIFCESGAIDASGADFIVEGVGEYAEYAWVSFISVSYPANDKESEPEVIESLTWQDLKSKPDIHKDWGSVVYESKSPYKIKFHVEANNRTTPRHIEIRFGSTTTIKTLFLIQAGKDSTP